ncbi:MAG: IMP dehydrogenase [Flavobacteriales bacterium]|nr:IMP dehydrogenase [Flavobacteriales bacterium]
MAEYLQEVSRTFNEFLFLPNLTKKDCILSNVNMKTPLVKFRKGESSAIELNTPFVSSIMQSVSNDTLAIALAKMGGVSFIFGSQPIENQVEMVKAVKGFKAGFVESGSNLSVNDTLKDVLAKKREFGFSTMGVTEDGTSTGKLLGIVTGRDYRVDYDASTKKVEDFMVPFAKLITATIGISLREANDIIWENKLNCLPVIDKNQNLQYLVFRKDYDGHKENPFAALDSDKRLIVGGGINTRDYKERVPALLDAGVDVLCVDSSDGHSEWQKETIEYVKQQFGEKVFVGGGNIVDKEGFAYMVSAGADFVKVGVGGGSICITREQKGIGRGQASSLIEVAKARDEHYEKTGVYIPLCSDGGITRDYQMALALAMGADFLMMGRYFARFDESPTEKLMFEGSYVKEYWGEGSNRARNWERYDMGDEEQGLKFEEGVDSFVPYAGKLKDNLEVTIAKIKSTMCSCGSLSLSELRSKARLVLLSSASIVEGGAHDVAVKKVGS